MALARMMTGVAWWGLERCEQLAQFLQVFDRGGLGGSARNQFFIVCWKCSTFPWGVGCPGRAFFCAVFRRRSSASNPLRRPAMPSPERRVVKTMPLTVSVEAGIPWVLMVSRNWASTMGS